MKDYKLILFDLDGTLLDTSQGIFNGMDKTSEAFGRIHIDDADKRNFIGPPVSEVFSKYYGITEESDLVDAVHFYRDYYAQRGYKEAELFPGMRELLNVLKEKGFQTGVCTMKREDMAIKVLQAQDLIPLFDVIIGNTDFESKTKADLIEDALARTQSKPEEAVLIGDTLIDAQGADSCKVDYIAALYGFGYNDRSLLDRYPYTFAVESVPEIESFLMD